MAARVTPEEVRQVIQTVLDPRPFIQAANLIITARLGTSGLPAAHLKELERWLTAHFIAVREPIATQKRLGDAMEIYEHGELGEGLKSTRYGQQVLLLDTTGTFASNNAKRRASFESLGV